MSVSAAQADAFYREALLHHEVWGIRDAGGFPAPEGSVGPAAPFWSARSRALRIIENVSAYRDFEPFAVPLDEWRARWLPGMARDGLRVGLNWSGSRATGYDLPPEDVERNLAAREGASTRQIRLF